MAQPGGPVRPPTSSLKADLMILLSCLAVAATFLVVAYMAGSGKWFAITSALPCLAFIKSG
jgi:hypothetical protein